MNRRVGTNTVWTPPANEHAQDSRELSRGFTLIELLIVVAIITILADIAIVNMLEAQTRAKVSRVKSDLRTIATATEAYAVDWNSYPMNDGVYNNLPRELTSPVAYLTTGLLVDPFTDKELHPLYGELERYYTYTEIVDYATAEEQDACGHTAPNEAIDHPLYNPGAFAKYGAWKLVSNGPDREYMPGTGENYYSLIQRIAIIDTPYDPTNGTVSLGNITRTHKEGSIE